MNLPETTLTSLKNAKKIAGLSCLLLILLCIQITPARTLEEYRKNISHIRADFAALLFSDGSLTAEDKAEVERAVLDKIPKMLPSSENIEIDGLTIETDNSWLAEKMKEYVNPEINPEDKRLILQTVYERLESIEIKIDELSRANADSKRNKDAEKRRLSEILSREEFQKPVEEESLIDKFLKWLQDLLKRLAPEPPKAMPKSNFGSITYVLQILLYVLIAAVVLFIVYKFAPLFLKKIREREKRESTERIILGEKLSADETSANLFSEAEKLAFEGNLREAIRKGYIALLFELSERKLIGLAKHKTNRDYLRSIRKKRELYANMNDLTLNYERHWYGFEQADEKDWEEFKNSYKKTVG